MDSGSGPNLNTSTEFSEQSSMSSYSLLASPTPAGSDEFQVVNDIATTTHLTSLLREQKYFSQMIDSLEPTSNLTATEAKVQSKHLQKFYDKFIHIQSKIAALIGDISIDDQVEISRNVQQKVRQIETKLEEMTSSNKTIPLTPVGSAINGHFNQTERPTSDILDTLFKKQNYLIKQMELIESKKNLGAAEAEILHGHVLQLHDEFVKNQSKIETNVSGSAFDEQLQMSDRILQKVIAVQIKLKGIIALVTTVSKRVSSVNDAKTSSVRKRDSSHVETQEISIGSDTSVRKRVSCNDIEAQGESLGSQSYLNEKLKILIYQENCVYKKILQNINHSPEVAGSIHLRPWVDESYRWFLSIRSSVENNVREFPYLLRKVEEISEKVDRVVKDYRLYCDGKIPRCDLDYISSNGYS
ncbi:uncharacterized protein LOC135831814 [Planococcus citri]|uniref:uncharacterized protein LOC135831814 n=1 Tax=Planococcus citri TaxID=170843 RepID=UPI0031F88E9F